MSQGYLLCYEEWRRSLENGQPAQLLFTARVTSSEARVYSLSLQEMQKIYNIDTLIMDGEWNRSYAQYLEDRTPLAEIANEPRPKPKEEPKVSSIKRAGDVWKIKELERAMQEAMVSCLLATDKRKPEKRKSSTKCLPTGRSVGTGSDLAKISGKEIARMGNTTGMIKRSKKKESILSSIFATTLCEER